MSTIIQNMKLVKPEFKEFTLEKLKSVIPSADQALTDKVNKLIEDPNLAREFGENLLEYGNVLSEGRYSGKQYVNAVQYASYQHQGYSKFESWKMVFPDRWQKGIARGLTQQELTGLAHSFHRSGIVKAVLTQSSMPSYIFNSHYFQEALEKQVDLMRNGGTERLQSDAAARVLEYTVMPTDMVDNREDVIKSGLDVLGELAKATAALASQTREAIKSDATTAKQVVERPIYDMEMEKLEELAQ